eukprot:Opistho-1_new@39696
MARAFAASLGVAVALLLVCSAAAETTPVLAWASNGVFGQHSTAPLQGAVTTRDFASVVSALSGAKNTEASALDSVLAASPASRVGAVLLFVQDVLSLGDMSEYAGAYGGASAPLAPVRALVDAAQSSLVARVSAEGGAAEGVISAFSGVDGRTVVADAPGAYVATPGRTDALIVRLEPVEGLDDSGKAAALARNAKTVAAHVAAVSKATRGSYAALLVADRAPATFYHKASPSHSRRAVEGASGAQPVKSTKFDPQQAADGGQLVGGLAADDDTSGWVFFTFPIFMGIAVVLLLVLILLGGVGALFSLQTPARFDDPRSKPIQLGK